MKRCIITGAPRSGTTAMHSLLSFSPNIFLFNELGQYYWPTYPDAVRVEHTLHPDREEAKAILDHKGVSMRAIRELVEAARSVAEMENMVGTYLGLDMIGDKYPPYIHDIEALMDREPDMHIIWMVRDGRAVLASTLRAMEREVIPPWAMTEPDETWWIAAARAHRKAVAKDQTRVHTVRYEALCCEPELGAARVCNEIGVPFAYSEACGFKPQHVDSWRQEYPELADTVSDEFVYFLEGYEYA